MTSRLDRLFILLESGSSAVTRRAAAYQIGEVQRLHPHELHNLLNRLLVYLHSSSWETRIAAAHAVEAILKHVPKWNPKIGIKNENDVAMRTDSGRLSFLHFDLKTVLDKGARLMGSEGTEFDHQEDGELDIRDRLMRQRSLLNEKLGLTQGNNLGVTLDDIVSLNDLQYSHKNSDVHTELIPAHQILKTQETLVQAADQNSSQSLSCREKNRARRKARQNQFGQQPTVVPTNSATISRSNSSNGSTSDIEPERKKIKLESMKNDFSINVNDPVPDGTGSWGDATEWPLEAFCSQLYIDLFNPRWETRHGAATALRELLKAHADGAGKCVEMSDEEQSFHHQVWLEDAVLRLLCVLSLDRFGDFVSDQVVAPVRETCAQVLGTILKEMNEEKVENTIDILRTLIKQKDWEVRHGGLLGIKYMLVVREDLLQTFLPLVINDILIGLFDSVDDVSAVAASTLIPIAIWLPKLLTPIEVSNIVKMLWDLLLDQDELTSACNSYMGLLASILSLPNASKWIQMEPMSKLVPRLWPFLSHSSSSVRRSTLQTLKTLTQRPVDVPETTLENFSQLNVAGEPTRSVELADKILNADMATMSYNFGVSDWPPQLLQEALRHIYQRVLVEPIGEIQGLVEKVWSNLVINADLSALLHATCPYVASWLCLAMQPSRLSFDASQLVYAKAPPPSKEKKSRLYELDGASSTPLHLKLYLGGSETTPVDVRDKNVMRTRCRACQMLGLLSHYLVQPAPGVIYTSETEGPIDCYTKVLIGYLESRSSLQRLISSLVIAFWAQEDISIRPGPTLLQHKLKYSLMEYVYYDEVAVLFTRLLQESRDFLATLKELKVPLREFENTKVLTLNQIQALCTTMTENLRTKFSLKPKMADLIDERRRGLHQSYTATSYEQGCLNVTTQAALASAIIGLHCLPDKLNPVIKPLMESVKREECEILQQLSAQHLVHLLDQVADRTPSPNAKILTNLCTLLKNDSVFTPKLVFTEKPPLASTVACQNLSNAYIGILTLDNQKKASDGQQTTRGPGRPPTVEVASEEIPETEETQQEKKQNRIQRIGAASAINAICQHFGADLKQRIPVIWTLMTENISAQITEHSIALHVAVDEAVTNDLMTSLQLIEIAAPSLHKSLHGDLFEFLPKMCILLRHQLKAIRHMTARCLATLASINPSTVMDMVIERVVPLLACYQSVIARQGPCEAIACIVNKLQFRIVPYVILLVVPLLGRMSDPDESVRLMSTNSFATLIQLMPLDGMTPDLPVLSNELQTRKMKDKEFLDYLFSPKTIPDFKVPVPINVDLRSYQQAGINWLWFLNKYKIHGILCDDMGLGKTLQAICILAGDHYQRSINGESPIPSLVICPPTLTGHWVFEVNKFLSKKYLNPLHYVGLPVDRERLRQRVSSCNLVVASYDIVRKDIDFFGSIHWNYCVLDEGHVIKNGRTKSSKAIKQLIANHRLILSGTPIQNNVLELWSLFDFLMPGFLGTEKQFMARFSRPILASRDAKSSAKEQEAGALAMEALHRQVLPFLLRRIKEDVLTDLPPKITQDLLCELSPLQERLYEDFSRTHLNSEVRDCLESIGGQNINKKAHVFQVLRYLQSVCNHPKLVVTPHHPEYNKIKADLAKSNSNLDDIDHSAKLPALKQLLLDCGIGNEDVSAVNQHRALIFFQLKAMLEIVENDLLKKHLPAVSYLRLDGSIPAGTRHQIVTKFNNDPSIDVLLLTTQVGGLGLNLTGADTVIFVEHDWNPMKDLQAMDRAHRIGQKKVVNVYRLITRKSLEEKIMGLQKFKLLTANTVVSAENASMETMGTEQLLDLFNLSDKGGASSEKEVNGTSGGGVGGNGNGTNTTTSSSSSMRNILESLPELWEDQQYEEEYDMSQFLDGLRK